jgi:hypothetical protein
MFQIPNAGSVYLYQKPINMRWGEKKLTQLCRDEMGIDPRAGDKLGALTVLPPVRKDLQVWTTVP